MTFGIRRFWQFAVLLAGLLPGAAAAQENSIYKELLDKGVPLANGKTIKLAAPVMSDGLDAAAQQAALAKLVADPLLAGFQRGGLNDWHELQMTDEKGQKADDSIGRRNDLYFVAKGKLETVLSDGFLKQQVNQGGDRGKVEFYTTEELQERKLNVVDNDQLKERYAHALLPLFNMVEISGTGHAIQTKGQDSVLVAFKLDPRFANDANYPNRWKSISVNPAGKKTIGPAQPYAGAGAYMKVTKLIGPEDRVFVEYHLVFDEPHGWFNGQPVLSSKLPTQYQADVRKFRRELKSYQPQPQVAGKK